MKLKKTILIIFTLFLLGLCNTISAEEIKEKVDIEKPDVDDNLKMLNVSNVLFFIEICKEEKGIVFYVRGVQDNLIEQSFDDVKKWREERDEQDILIPVNIVRTDKIVLPNRIKS